MAILESVFNAVQYASNMNDGDMFNRFRTGTPPASTTVLSTFHAYRSLAWFDAEAIAAALVGERVLSISFSATSEGVNAESAEAVPVRLYRTNLHYDATKQGWTDANTKRPDLGMTYDNPYNDHFIEYGETGAFVRGESLSDSLFMEGDPAARLAEALADGCALGTWALKPGRTMTNDTPPYRVRYMSDVSITIRHEPESTNVTAPTSAIILDNYASAGTAVRLNVSGATQPESGVNPITGYKVSARKSADGVAWGDWSNDEIIETDETTATLLVTVSAQDDYHVQLRVATTSAMNTSNYLIATGEVIIASSPEIGSVLYKISGRRIDYTVYVPSSPYAGNLYVYLNDECRAMLPYDGGIARFHAVYGADGKHEDTLYVADEYGGTSEEKGITAYTSRNDAGNNWFSFNGRRSEDYGLLVTEFLQKSSASERVKNDTVIGRYGDLPNRENDDIYDAYDATFQCISLGGFDADIRSWLAGDGDIIMGDDPNEIYSASIQQAVEMSRFSRGISDKVIVVRVHLQPFKRHTDDDWMPLARSGLSVLNDGDCDCYPTVHMNGTGNLTVEIAGKRLIVQSVEGECWVDCYNRVAYDAENKLLETSGDFPTIPVGLHEVVFSDTVANGEIKRNRLYR